MCRSEEGRDTGRDVSLRIITSEIPSLLVVSYFMSSLNETKHIQKKHHHHQQKNPKSVSTHTVEHGGSADS